MFTITLAKAGQILTKFLPLNSEKKPAQKAEIKTTISPQICCHTTLQKVRVQLRSFTAQMIQFKLVQRHLITVNVHEGCSFFVFFTTHTPL